MVFSRDPLFFPASKIHGFNTVKNSDVSGMILRDNAGFIRITIMHFTRLEYIALGAIAHRVSQHKTRTSPERRESAIHRIRQALLNNRASLPAVNDKSA